MKTYRELARAVSRRRPRMVQRIGELVGVESPTEDRLAVNRCVGLVERWMEELGGTGRRRKQRVAGDLLVGRFGPGRGAGKPLMLLGHLDTVWPVGTLGKMPFRVRGGRAGGPGVLDMKTGVVMALTALEVLAEGGQLNRPVIFLLNSDEETGSEHSRSLTESLARQCAAVFVLEPAQGLAGAYKTARKGVANYRLEVQGVAAHSGVDFSSGHSAVLELGRQIERASAFTNLSRGITVNPGVIGGGTRSNVIAAEAWAEFDVRVAKAADAPRLDRRFHAMRPIDRKCKLAVTGGLNRPPIGKNRWYRRPFPQCRNQSGRIGFRTTGSSDGWRLGWQFHVCVGHTDARRDGCGGRRRPCGSRIHSARCACSQNSAAGSNDWRPVAGVRDLG